MRLGQVCELETGPAADLLLTADRGSASTAVDGVEGVLKGSNKSPFAGRQRHEKITLSGATVDPHRARYSQRHPRKAEQPFDAPREQLGLDFRTPAADLINEIARIRQAAPAFQQRLTG